MMTEPESRSSETPSSTGEKSSNQPDEDPSSRTSEKNSPVFWDKVRNFLFQRHSGGNLRENLEDELARETATDATFSPEERMLLGNILRLRELRVDDVMIPRANIEAVDGSTPLGRVMEIFQESGHSRMPVYDETLDDPSGMVHIKDVVGLMVEEGSTSYSGETDGGNKSDGDKADRSETDADAAAVGIGHNSDQQLDLSNVALETPLKDTGLVRSLLFVPPSMPATDLMAKMQADRIQMALVIDEYGGTDGLVSLEDLVEEVVGDIEDEHDEDEDDFLKLVSEGVWSADPRIPLEDLDEVLGTELTDCEASEDVDTLGGLLYVSVGRVPVRGELVQVKDAPGFEFEVLDADPRRIKRLGIRRRRVTDLRLAEQRRRVRRPANEADGATGALSNDLPVKSEVDEAR